MPNIQLWQTVVKDIHKLCINELKVDVTLFHVTGIELSTSTDANVILSW